MHIPVLVNEVVENLQPTRNQNCIDCTVGGGGHAKKILERISPQGRLLGIDWDKEAIKIAQVNLKNYHDRSLLVNDNYAHLKRIVAREKFFPVNLILVDLGFSSDQLSAGQRGFSFKSQGKLDLRYSQDISLTGDEIVNDWPAEDLTKIFRNYGEERLAGQIAAQIVSQRQVARLTIDDLHTICWQVYRRFYRRKSKIDPATKVWQALRIFINNELENIRTFLPQALEVLETGGRLAVITFHSLEDKLVKDFIKVESKGCICPPALPVCRCGHQAILKKVNSRVIIPTIAEVKTNPRSRSAKLRVVEKITN